MEISVAYCSKFLKQYSHKNILSLFEKILSKT
jgi:hypothetical protein